MNNFPNGAGFHDYEDVGVSEIHHVMPKQGRRIFLSGAVMHPFHQNASVRQEALEAASLLLSTDRARRKESGVVFHVLLAMLAIGILIYAMHGDQAALNNGFIH